MLSTQLMGISVAPITSSVNSATRNLVAGNNVGFLIQVFGPLWRISVLDESIPVES